MATVVIMPKQGQSVESCILTELKKKKGDKVAIGDVLFAYETDKASFEEEAKVAGEVLEVFYNEGDEIPVLVNVLVIGEPGESIEGLRPEAGAPASAEAVEEKPREASAPQKESAAPQPQVAYSSTASAVSPRARALADKHAIDAASLKGSGPGGRVIADDVEAAVNALPRTTPLAKAMIKEGGLYAPAAGDGLAGMVRSSGLSATASQPTMGDGDSVVKPLTNMRKLIARSMHASLQNSAQLTHHLGADARRIMELRKVAKANGLNVTINDLVCFAVIRALKQYPQVNAHFEGDSMRLFNHVHLGLAVDTDRGLMVPVVRDADLLSIEGLAARLKEVAEACKSGSISPDLLSPVAASFTVSNLGNYGVEMFTPVINLPQVAILGVNTIVPRPKDLGGGVYAFVPYMGLSLTYDHRALDGGEATRFLKQIAIEIENLNVEL
ncbi:2-oxo acid dehydrogenase subunit E2 [Parabacteroides sp. OttesenSCG-928-O15]|nr:2-oxo acid dehydrogenase subunit E2 [Parabacteroides sp. OttesenSCG-928-O15]